MEVNCSITCNVKGSSIRIEAGSMPLNFFAHWNICMASMSSIGGIIPFLVPIFRLTELSRDLKPENILLDYTGHIALCDFGKFGVSRIGPHPDHLL